jgi:hypothetical protein
MSDIETANWSETAASNNAAPPNGMPEGMAPSGVNDAGREIMGAVKREWDRSHPTVTSGGSANAQTLSYSVNPGALVQGQVYSFIAGFTNTGPASLQVGSLVARTLKLDGQGLLGGEIGAGNVITVFYDGSAYQIVSSRPIPTIPAKNILINPDFDIWQRGAGDSAIIVFPASSSTYGPDRWYVGSGANEAGTVSASGIVVGGSRHSALVERTAGQTGTSPMNFGQALTTDQMIQMQGRAVTISGWAIAGANFSPTNGTVTIKLYVGTSSEAKRGGGFTGETLVASASLNLMSGGVPAAAQKFTATGTVPFLSTQGEFRFEWTPVGTAGAQDYVAFQQCKLEIGNQATAFQAVQFADELARCQRFYWKTFPYATAPAQNTGSSTGALQGVQAAGAGANGFFGNFPLPTRMRVVGSVITYNPLAANANARNADAAADATIGTAPSSETTIAFSITTAGGSAAGQRNVVHVTIDSEL